MTNSQPVLNAAAVEKALARPHKRPYVTIPGHDMSLGTDDTGSPFFYHAGRMIGWTYKAASM